MKNEYKSHLIHLGKVVKQERKKRKMTQTEFYEFLFPDNDEEELNVKKKMNYIENAKWVEVKYELLLALNEKCELSMDYLLGFENKYPNHDNKFACLYTGLSVETINLLHRLSKAKNADIPPLSSHMDEQQRKKRCQIFSEKMEADWILKISDLLFFEGKDKKGRELSNLKLLFDLYMISVSKPERLFGLPIGTVNKDDDCIDISYKNKELYFDSLLLSDSFDVTHSLDIEEVYQQIWRNRLERDLEEFIAEVRALSDNKINSEKLIPDHKPLDLFGLDD